MAKLVFLGRLRELAGYSEKEAALPDGVETAADVVVWLTEADPDLGAALTDPSVRVAVNQELIALADPVADGDEIAFLPPMSGG